MITCISCGTTHGCDNDNHYVLCINCGRALDQALIAGTATEVLPAGLEHRSYEAMAIEDERKYVKDSWIQRRPLRASLACPSTFLSIAAMTTAPQNEASSSIPTSVSSITATIAKMYGMTSRRAGPGQFQTKFHIKMATSASLSRQTAQCPSIGATQQKKV